jgi:hypothetical protein
MSPENHEGQDDTPVSDLTFVDTMEDLLRKARGLAAVTQNAAGSPVWPEHLGGSVVNVMEVLIEQLDAALALLNRWHDGRHGSPDAPNTGAQ